MNAQMELIIITSEPITKGNVSPVIPNQIKVGVGTVA